MSARPEQVMISTELLRASWRVVEAAREMLKTSSSSYVGSYTAAYEARERRLRRALDELDKVGKHGEKAG